MLNTYDNMLNDNFSSIKSHPKKYMNYRIDWLMSGMELHQKYVKTSYIKYAQVHTGSYQDRWESYNVLDSKMIDAHKTVPISCYFFAHYSMSFY